MTAVAERQRDGRSPPGGATSSRWPAMALLALAGATAILGAARWTGQPPFGSDNDEYQLVARQLLHYEAPVVAGVEGTKYPLGYPAVVAAFDAVGLPPVDSALFLNVLLVGVAAALTALAARHRGPTAAVVAAGVVLVSRPLWAATQSTMPDVAFTAVVAGALAITGTARTRAAAFTALTVVATALKSVGVLLGAAATLSLLWPISHVRGGRSAKERTWLALAAAPVGAGLAVAVVSAAVLSRYPEHTTGYSRTFWLDDPYDAAGGRASLLDVAGRLFTRMDNVLDDAAHAVWGDLVHGPPAWALTVALVAAGVYGARHRLFVAAFVVLDLVALAVWPFSSVRFGLPLVPIAALGAGTLAGTAAAAARLRTRTAVTIATAAIAVLVTAAVPALRAEADREAAFYADLNRARADVVANLPDDAVAVSPDYRELATALPRDRAVLPLTYTTDTDALLAEAQRGTHLVVLRGLYGQRDELVARLLTAHGDRFDLVYGNERFDVYAVNGP